MVDLVSITLAGLLDRPMKSALERLWPSSDDLRNAVSSLVAGQERQRMAPVVQAASHLELGELPAAQQCLLTAESHEPYAPVVKLALAMVLARTGVTGEPVDRRIAAALHMNPLLAPAHPGAGSHEADSRASDAPAIPSASSGPARSGAEPPDAWATALTRAVVRKDGQARLSGMATYSKLMSVAVASQSRAVAAWRSRNLAGGNSPCLAAFDLSNGSVRWARTGPEANSQLVLAAPGTLILRPWKPAARGRLEVADTWTGAHLADFSPDAFRLLFWPGWVDGPGGPCGDARYWRSHRELGRPQDSEKEDRYRYEALAAELRRSDADVAERRQGIQLSDPLDPDAGPVMTASSVERLRRYPPDLRRYVAPASVGGRFWSTVVSSEPPGFKLYTCRALLRRTSIEP